jgi:hypothetical protein
MAQLMLMEWDGVTPEQYERVMQELRLDEDPPEGGMFHLAGFTDRGIRVVDVWESEEHFGRFMTERLQAVTQEVGMEGEPNVQFCELSNVWAPRGEEVIAMGASALVR